MFDLLQSGEDEWLARDPRLWEGDAAYKMMENVVLGLAVVNDTAERSIADVTKYANSATDGGRRARIIGVVDWHRSVMPSFDKEAMANAE